MLQVQINGQITINDMTAEFLKYVIYVSGFTKEFREHIRQKYTVEQIEKQRNILMDEIYPILNARDSAIKAINEEFKKKVKK
jgi:hypothetical protein